MIISAHQRLLTLSCGSQINVIPTPLRRDDTNSPWCYAFSLSPPLHDFDDDEQSSRKGTTFLGANFLATQVWPSSRIAASIIEQHMDQSWSVCELGCGPGLPSLTASKKGARVVIATDVDECALEMVEAAAKEQGFLVDNRFRTQKFDLTSRQTSDLPDVDLYILSDVFESGTVAEGAAFHIQSLLSKNNSNQRNKQRRVWVFAQSKQTYDESLEWSTQPDLNRELCLFDLDETIVEYN